MREQPVVGGAPGQARAAPASSTGSSATCMCTPTPRSVASPHTASSVSSESVKHACAPTRPRPPDRRNRSFSARPALARVGAVAIGDLVATHHPHADFGARFRDHVETALDCTGTGMVVDDRGRARLERFERAEPRTPTEHVERRAHGRRRHHTCSRISGKLRGVCGGEGIPRRARNTGACAHTTRPGDRDRSAASCLRPHAGAAHRQPVPPFAVEVVQGGRDRARGRHETDLAHTLDPVRRAWLRLLDRGSCRSGERPWPG